MNRRQAHASSCIPHLSACALALLQLASRPSLRPCPKVHPTATHHLLMAQPTVGSTVYCSTMPSSSSWGWRVNTDPISWKVSVSPMPWVGRDVGAVQD